MESLILNIAINNPQGFTFNLQTRQLVTTGGWVVAYKATQNSFGESGLRTCLEHASNHQNLVGGWLNEDNDLFYFDSVMIIEDKEEAIRVARDNEQIGIYHIDTDTYLDL